MPEVNLDSILDEVDLRGVRADGVVVGEPAGLGHQQALLLVLPAGLDEIRLLLEPGLALARPVPRPLAVEADVFRLVPTAGATAAVLATTAGPRSRPLPCPRPRLLLLDDPSPSRS